jgi:hypothetical protein
MFGHFGERCEENGVREKHEKCKFFMREMWNVYFFPYLEMLCICILARFSFFCDVHSIHLFLNIKGIEQYSYFVD